jgi:hypothetical protein
MSTHNPVGNSWKLRFGRKLNLIPLKMIGKKPSLLLIRNVIDDR